jgi:O-antigen/teichoic acid export membrane protein
MFSAFICTVFLARKLSIADFGGYSLLKQIMTIAIVIATLGLGQSYTRNFVNKNGGLFRIHFITGSILLLMSLFLSFFIQQVYDYTKVQTIFIFSGIFCGSASIYMSEIYRINNHYCFAQIAESGWKIVLLLLVVLLYIFNNAITLDNIYILIFLSFLAPSLTFFKFAFYSYKEQQPQKIDLGVYVFTGFTFWIINSLGLLSGAIEKFIIPFVFSKEILGIFTSLSFVYITYFSMIGSAIGYVLFPTLSKGEKVNWKKMSMLIFTMIVISIILFIILGEHLTNILYGGKYDAYNSWFFILSFIFLGIIQMINTITHFIVLAFGKQKDLFIYLIVIITSTGLFLGVIWLSQKLKVLTIEILTIYIIGMWLVKLLGIFTLLYQIVKRRRFQREVSQNVNVIQWI